MIEYKSVPVESNGIRFELETGTINELYGCITGALGNFYNRQGLNLISPKKPNFEYLPGRVTSPDSHKPGKVTSLESHKLEKPREGKEPSKHGQIKMTYFKVRGRIKARRGVDYTASETYGTIGGETTYESLTIFFKTRLPNIDSDAFQSMRKLERDVFFKQT